MQDPAIAAAAEWAHVELTPHMAAQLEHYAQWLISEAADAGGIGPDERGVVHVRHIADSLLFAGGWRPNDPRRILDIGTGVGLPLVPLAITHPRIAFVGLDRAGRRIRLLRRAVRVLELNNVVAQQGDVRSHRDRWEVIVSRAAIPPERLRPELGRLLDPEGVAVVGGSHLVKPVHAGYETIEIPPEVLDRAAWLLKMAPS